MNLIKSFKISIGYKPHQVIEWLINPGFDNLEDTNIDDWRRFVDPIIIKQWNKLSEESRIISFIMAKKIGYDKYHT